MTRVYWNISALLLALAIGCQQVTEEQAAPTAETAGQQVGDDSPTSPREIALAAKDALFTQLSSRLTEAMSKGGPAAAIEVCSVAAPKIATEVGAKYGVAIGRTSHRLRNSANLPPQWAAPYVEAQNDEPQFVDLQDGRLGALLPIHLKVQCLQCHGPVDRIADDVQAQLAALYPDDDATGFAEGDLRGWFWVEVPAP